MGRLRLPLCLALFVALALMLIGLLGTFAGVLPVIAGQPSQVIGAWAFVAAAVVLFVGMIFEGI